MSLLEGGRYDYSVVGPRDSLKPKSGEYRTYSAPVDRVEFKALCLQAGECGDYPAEVLAGEPLKLVVEDIEGEPLSLAKCDPKLSDH